MDIEIYMRLRPEQLEQLEPALRSAGVALETDIVSVEWENPRNKKSVYQLLTGDNLQEMVDQFNDFLANEGNPERLNHPDSLSIAQQYRTLQFLNNNAEWMSDSDMAECWMEGDAKEQSRVLNLYRDILSEKAP